MSLKRYSVNISDELVSKLDELPGARATWVEAAIVDLLDKRMRVMAYDLCDTRSQNPDATTIPTRSDPVSQSDELSPAAVIEYEDDWHDTAEPRGASGARVLRRYPPGHTTIPKGSDQPSQNDDDGLDDVLGGWT